MLYDQKWDKTELKPSLADLRAWLREEDPKGEYVAHDAGKCAMAKYTADRGWHLRNTEAQAAAIGMDKDNFMRVFVRKLPYTYGALLRRLDAYAND
jgi:hypothetical protein